MSTTSLYYTLGFSVRTSLITQSSHLKQGFPSSSFFVGLFSITFFIIDSRFLHTRLTRFILLMKISFIILGRWKKYQSSRLYFILHSPIRACKHGPQILRIFLLKIFNFIFSVFPRDRVFELYNTTRRINVMGIWTFTFETFELRSFPKL